MILPLHGHLHGPRLSAFVDGELAADEAHRWRAHLLECRACSAAVSDERALRARVRHACAPPPPMTLVMSLRVVAAGGGCERQASPAASRAGRGAGVARRLPLGVVAATTTAAAAAVVGLAASGLASPAVPMTTSPRPAAAVTVPPVPVALAPAAVPFAPANLGRVPSEAATGVATGASTGPTGMTTGPATGAPAAGTMRPPATATPFSVTPAWAPGATSRR